MIKICNYPLEYFIYIIIFILVLTIIISLFRTNTTTDTFDKKVIEKFEDESINNNGLINSSNGLMNSSNGLMNSSNGFMNSNNGFMNSNNGLMNSNNGFMNSSNGLMNSSNGLMNSSSNGLMNSNNGLMNSSNGLMNSSSNGLITNELDKYKRELELSKIKEDKLKTEIELIKNYTKINDTDFFSINIHASKIFFGNGFIIFPTLKDNAKIIDSNNNLNLLISKTSNLKNIYKVGEKVLNDSTFYITNNDICYSNLPSSETGLYNGCVVCSINPSNNYISNKNKTNIESVCLYNDDKNKIDSTIPTSSLCEDICIGRG